ncbi:MAG: exodeoxyribonuclease VII large subunit, partial [Bauldia sp.]
DLLAPARRTFDDLAARSGLALIANARVHRTRFERVGARLSIAGLTRAVERASERLTAAVERKRGFFLRRIERLGGKLGSLAKLLDAVSYRSVLDRGFALVSADGAPVRSAAAVPAGKVLDIEFHDGHVTAVSNGLAPAKRKRRGPDDGGSQGTLI